MTLGASFLFAEEEEGDISSVRPLAGQSVLPLHNHRNPEGSGEGLCTLNHDTNILDWACMLYFKKLFLFILNLELNRKSNYCLCTI